MSKNTKGNDIGYRAYFAAFAVMIVIVIAAVCILSGCFDSVIFKADAPSQGDTDGIESPIVNDGENDVGDTNTPLPVDSDNEPVDTDNLIEPDTEEPDNDTEKNDDTTEEPVDTTKTPEESTTEPEETTTKPEETTTEPITTPEETTPEPTTPEETSTAPELDEDEIITGQNNHILYDYEDDGLIITGYDGLASSVSVPMYLDGVEVKMIGKGAFAGRSDLEEVKLSAGIKSIGSDAFGNCASLVFVYIPTTVKSIASDAFDGSENVIIYCAEGSYAEHYASDNGIECYID